MCVWGGGDQEETHSCTPRDTVSRVLKHLIVSSRSDQRSSRSIVLPAMLGNQLETELSV